MAKEMNRTPEKLKTGSLENLTTFLPQNIALITVTGP
jgi:hypothetical protein